MRNPYYFVIRMTTANDIPWVSGTHDNYKDAKEQYDFLSSLDTSIEYVIVKEVLCIK